MKTRFLFGLFAHITCAVFSLPALYGASGPMEARLFASAAAEGEIVRLADIAALRGADSAALSEIVVYRFSDNERERRLSYAMIEAAIRAGYAGPLVLVGSGLVVTRAVSVVTRQRMQSAINAHFAAHYPYAVFEADARSLPERREFFGGDVSFSVVFAPREAPPGKITSGPFTAELVARNGERELDRIPFSGTIRLPGRVLVAAHALGKGRTLRSSDVRFQELSDTGGLSLLTFEELAGRRILEDIPEGARLLPEQFEKPILVRRGMRVTVVWARAGVSIEAEAVAVDDGREGDIVRLRNTHSGREFAARVGSSLGRVYSDG